ncbi:MAG: hypothetical protein MI749_03345, partial [Desulfovibrionales bacterium]|nr:hypothetical protein [Desulfovibrionales bacterium]
MKYAAIALCLALFLSPPLGAAEKIRTVEVDTDKDGITDQIRTHDARGTILTLLTDRDQDGFFEQKQRYEKGEICQLIRDTDQDKIYDIFDFMDRGKRIRQEQRDTQGRIILLTRFDESQAPLSMEKDTTGDGNRDTFYSFTKGELTQSRRDTTKNGIPDLFTWFANQLPTRRQMDPDEDGHMDKTMVFDKKGGV